MRTEMSCRQLSRGALWTAAISLSGNRGAVVYGRLWKNCLSAEKKTDGLEYWQLCVCDGQKER